MENQGKDTSITFTELSTKKKGTIPSREIKKVLPVCNKNVPTLLLLETKAKTLSVLKFNGDELQEIWSKSFEDFEKVVGLSTNTDVTGFSPEDALVLVKNSKGIEFHKLEATTGELKYLALDDAFADDLDWGNQVILQGQFRSDPKTVSILTLRDKNDTAKVFTLNGSDIEAGLKRQWSLSFPEELKEADQVWVTKSGYTENDVSQPDWISGRKDDNIFSYKIVYDSASEKDIVEKVLNIKLPNDLKDTVKSIQLLPVAYGASGKIQNIVVFFKEDVAITYGYEEGKEDFQIRSYFYGSNSFLSSSCDGKQVFSISDGPTVKAFKGETLSNIPVRWSGDLLKSTFVLNDNKENIWLVGNSNDSDDLLWYNTEVKEVDEPPYIKPNRTLGPGQEFPEVPVTTINEMKLNCRVERSILDSLSSKVFSEAVNMQTGGVTFELKLVPEVGFGIQYTSTQVGFKSPPTLGKDGWSTRSPDYIAMNAKSDTLDSEAKYYLVLDGAAYTLEYKENLGEGKISYKVINSKITDEEADSIHVTQDTKKSFWIVDTKTSTLTFGDKDTAVKWGWSLRTWEESKEKANVKVPAEWYLTRLVKKENNPELKSQAVLLYDYYQVMTWTDDDDESKRKQYIDTVQLVKVQSENSNEVSVNFDYDGERKLVSYDAQVEFYKQSVQFLYDNNILTEIQQKLSDSWQTMIKLSYDYTGQVSTVVVPHRELEVNYGRQKHATQGLEGEILTTMQDAPANTMTTAAHSASLSVFATTNRIVAYHSADGKTEELGRLGKPFTEDLKELNVVIHQNCVIRHGKVSHGDYITVYCFDATADNSEWKLGKDLYLQGDIKVKLSQTGNLVTLNETGMLKIDEWVFEDSDFKSVFEFQISSTDERPENFQASDNIIAWYKEKEGTISWVAKTYEGWSKTPLSHQISNPRYEDCYTFFKNNFDLGYKLEEAFDSVFSNMKFHLKENTMAVTTCSIDDNTWQIKSHVDLLVIDRQGNPGLVKKFQIPQENLKELKKHMEGFDFRYVKESGKFLLEVSDPEYPKNTEAITKDFREQNAKEDWRLIIFDYEKYIGYFLSNHLFQVGNSTQLKHDDNSWIVDTEYNPNAKYDLKLGEDFKLAKAGEDKPIDLINEKTSETLYSLSTESKNVFPFYPGFVASLDGNNTEIVYFNRDAYGRELTGSSRLSDEVIHSGLSSPEFLVTYVPDTPHIFKIRHSGFIFNSLHESFIVNSVKIKGNELEKNVSYDYQKARMTRSRQINFGEASLISGADKSKFGYIKYSFDINEKYPKAYDGNDIFIEELRPEQNSTSAENPTTPSMLMDKLKIKPITDLSPFLPEDCQVGYLGFEDYEETSAGPNCPWNFPKTSVVRSKLALTGNNFLRLEKPEDTLSIEFPFKKDQSYSISTWVRYKTKEEVTEKVSKILQANILSQGVSWVSNIIFRRGDWQYLEIKINAHELKSLWGKFSKKNLDGNDQKIQIQIQRGDTDGNVDVDNVMFSPTSWSSEIFVYNEKGEVSHNLLANSGLIVQKMYDGIEGTAVAKTNGLGQVNRMQYETLEKANSLKSLVQFESLDEPGWIQGFQRDPLANFSPSDGKNLNVFRNGFHYKDYTNANTLSLDIHDYKSLAFRFSYAFPSQSDEKSELKVVLSNREFILTSGSKIGTKLTSSSFSEELTLQPSGSILFGLFNSRLLIWSPEGLLWEDGSVAVLKTENKLQLKLVGDLIVEDMIILPNPSLRIAYFDTHMQEVQVINMINETTAKITENSYDQVGRIQAKIKDTFIKSSSNQKMMMYRPDFVKSIDVENQKLEGEANNLNSEDGGVPFVSVAYEKGPTEEWKAEGRPGTQYSISGSFGSKFSKDPHEKLTTLFPPADGYKYKSKTNRDGYTEVVISDKKDSIVANAAITPGSKHLLATYDYDDKGMLVAALPPQYHEQENTLLTLNKTWKEIGYSKDSPLGTFYDYDEKGNMISKSAPDTGTFEYVFKNETGNPMFALHKASRKDQAYESVIYYDYQEGETLLSEIGELTGFDSSLTIDKLISGSLKLTKNPIKVIEQLGRRYTPLTHTQRITTKQTGSDNMDVIQELDFQLPHGRLSADTFIIPSETDKPSVLIPTRYQMSLEGDKVLMTGYALDDTALGYSYDLLGKVSQVYLMRGGVAPVTLARYEYAPNGQVSKETLLDYNTGNQGLINPLVTTIQFNSPGYPVKYTNPFFVQDINYDDNGYGDLSTGEPAYPTSTTFDSLWSQDSALLSLENLINYGLNKNDAEVCYSALQRLGYLDDYGKMLKLFRSDMDVEGLPIVCAASDSRSISTAFSEIFMERMKYSYKFQYGNQKELIKVKFVDSKNDANTCSSPLTPESLQEALAINPDTATKLWKELSEKKFLIEDKEKGKTHAIQGKSNISLWNRDIVNDLLEKQIQLYIRYATALSYTLGSRVGNDFPLEEFSKIFDVWATGMKNVGATAPEMYKLLQDKGYLNQTKVQDKILNTDFTQILKSLSLDTKKVFSVLSSFFACEIGSHPLDMEVFEMDYNGNPKLFYSGFARSELKYHPNTNKILSRETKDFRDSEITKTQEFTHDAFGNLNSILDKEGKPLFVIDYDKISSRPLKMELADGRKLYFRYDYKGERVSKQVFGASGKLEQEIKYLGRDSQGRVLVEQELTYVSETLPPRTKTTAFFYGPRGLLGFLRNGKYFNVLLDNIGSTRLVLRNGQVVASYTYLPYGKLASKYIGFDPDGDIRYRFTGQEFDDETGLYNFHFRIYDPVLGRFYQVDPLEVFFSPYKYVGNAPIVFTDPDGREPITIIITVTLVLFGAFLGAAAVNNSWNPANWNWGDYRTYLGLGFGALAGGLMPGGLAASFAAFTSVGLSSTAAVATIIGIGSVTAYLGMASSMNSWDPTNWDWTSPELFNAAFNGFATGAGFAGGITSVKNTFVGFTKTAYKVAYTSGITTLGIAFAYYETSSANGNEFRFWKWDFTNPGTFNGLIVSGISGATLAHNDKVNKAKSIKKAAITKTKTGFSALDRTIRMGIKIYGSFDVKVVVNRFFSAVPGTKFRAITVRIADMSDFSVSNFESPTMSMCAKEDWDRVAQSSTSSTFAVLQGISGDLSVTNNFNNASTVESFGTSSRATDEDIWLEQFAKMAFAGLQNSSTKSDSIRATAILMNDGSKLALTGLSGFSFDRAVLLLDKSQNPEIFSLIETQISGLENLPPTGQSQQALDVVKINKLVSIQDEKISLAESTGVHDYCEGIGHISNFDMKNNPFMEILPRGPSFLIPQQTEEIKTVLTQSGWKSQINPISACHSKYQPFSNVTSPDSVGRVRRDANNHSMIYDFEETQYTKWTSGDDTVLPPSTSSGSQPTGVINYGAKMISKLWTGFRESFSQKHFKVDESAYNDQIRETGNFYGRKQAGKQDTSPWSKCVPWVLSEDGYGDGFTCFSSNGIVQVTPKLQAELDQGAIMATDSQDTYGNCNFYKGRSIGSAYCEGNKSNMRYISFIDERPFDRVNDNLLLIALLLHFYQTWKSDDFEDTSNTVPIEIEKVQGWRRELMSLRSGLQQLRNQTKDEFFHDWAWKLLEDRMTDLETFEKQGVASPDSIQEFEDNLTALRDEICEGYFLSHFY